MFTKVSYCHLILFEGPKGETGPAGSQGKKAFLNCPKTIIKCIDYLENKCYLNNIEYNIRNVVYQNLLVEIVISFHTLVKVYHYFLIIF